jgi:hypothetical protein
MQVAVAVNGNGVLNAIAFGGQTLDWPELSEIGNSGLLPGSKGAVIEQPTGVFTALVVDGNGALTATSFRTAPEIVWRDTTTVGTPCFVPGSPIAIAQPAVSIFTALIIDNAGVLTVASLDVSTGHSQWSGPERIGNADFVPGSAVSVIQTTPTSFAALMVDRCGILNIATLAAAAGARWLGPIAIGGMGLTPGPIII